jgi:Zn-dependent oligopeptidase
MSVVLLNYKDLTKEKLDNILAKYIDQNELINKKILTIQLSELNWNNLVEPYVILNNNFIDLAYLNMKQFHENEQLREYASNISVKLTQYNIESSMRLDLYKINKYYYDNQYLLERNNLTPEQISYIEDAMVGYKKLGLNLPEEKYNQLKKIKKEITQLTTEYDQNVDNYRKSFEFTLKEIDGLPESFIKEHTTDSNKIKVTLDYPDYIPMMEYCKNRNIRKQLNFEFGCRAKDTNVEIAEKVFLLRKEIADLFNVENYSDYKLEDTMAGSTQSVMNFLDKLLVKIKPLLHRDIDILLSYAKEDNIQKIEPYDIAYYSRIHTEKETLLNKEELKKYFPVRQTIKNVFAIYQTLLNYTFSDITDEYKSTLWSEEVKLFMVKSNDLIIGYFYLDLFPRDGKYGHAAVFPCINKSNSTYPVAAMACNFAKDFMTFDELETFFHEFGHVMHHMSSISKISGTASFSCESDFVETPSQMFEEWVYINKTLKIISPTITDDIIEKIKKQRNILQGYHYARQLSFCYLDMNVHSKNYNHNSFETNKRITKEILGLDIQENTNSLASFGHLMGGYDAGYYGYLWSLVYAKDLFTKFIDHELDSHIGIEYRDEVLSQGSIRPSMKSIKIFLNREPNENAFIESIL